MADDRCQPLQGASPRGGSAWRQRRNGPYKRGLNTKIHLAVDAHGMPVRVLATEATRADCSHAGELIEGFAAEHLIADKGYDSDVIVEQARYQGMRTVIPPRKNRKDQREYDKHLYRQRHLVENAFLLLKQWRGIATRYAKRLSSFLAATQMPRTVASYLVTTLSRLV